MCTERTRSNNQPSLTGLDAAPLGNPALACRAVLTGPFGTKRKHLDTGTWSGLFTSLFHLAQATILSMRAPFLLALSLTFSAMAYDFEGHHLVNQLAVQALPSTFPEFTKTAAARERIAYLGGEADRWRNTNELPLRHFNNPDHYFD